MTDAAYDAIEISDYTDCSDAETFESDTTSLSSSVFNYTYENGRRYASDRKSEYHLPNDEKEQERLDILHHFWGLLMDGELHSAPLKPLLTPGARILDLGTGTGIWAIDLGDLHPHISILGTDLSPIQPSWTPPNVRFEIDDLTEPWAYPPSKPFTYIHSRTLLGSSIRDWPQFFTNCYSHLIPGGYVEVQEGEFSVFSEDSTTIGSAYESYTKDLIRAGSAMGLDFSLTATDFAGFMTAAGFEDVTVKKWKVPLGTWPKNPKLKNIGMVWAAAGMTGMEAYGLAMFTRVLGMSKEEAEERIRKATADMCGRKVHSLHYFYTVYGRKPGKAEEC